MRTRPGDHSGGFSGHAVRWLFVAVLFTAALLTAPAAEAKYASFVIDIETGEVLHETNPDTRNYPASLTKMMTLYMIFDALEHRRLSLDTRITFSARAARQPSSKLGIRKGGSLTVGKAIEALIVKSANDVASAVAEHMGGTERKFAMSMTSMARKIGMSRTTFRNASGLPHRGQLSTARDMATLATRLYKDFNQYYHYFSAPTFKFDGLTYRSHNDILKTYKGADGFKTGYIRASGFNLVASVDRDGQRLIGVVFGSRSSKARSRHMAKLLDKGFMKLNPQLIEVAANKKTKNVTIKTRWGIQVGAYKTVPPALEIAQKAIERAPDLLIDGTIKVVPLKKKNGQRLYRARILNLSKTQAYQACRVLKRRKINCMELRMTEDMQQLAAVTPQQ
ncbi:MAG: D-alanyl-D-alanine carboxypeptidase [Rhodospirillaceae bacterium]|nr:D-alanyl-D-alanine carboxypeptidase [Rhodospirillaceae bacterium]